jgi:hypothetical protein
MIYITQKPQIEISQKVTCDTIEEMETLELELGIKRANHPHYTFIEITNSSERMKLYAKEDKGRAKFVSDNAALTFAHALTLKSNLAVIQ